MTVRLKCTTEYCKHENKVLLCTDTKIACDNCTADLTPVDPADESSIRWLQFRSQFLSERRRLYASRR